MLYYDNEVNLNLLSNNDRNYFHKIASKRPDPVKVQVNFQEISPLFFLNGKMKKLFNVKFQEENEINKMIKQKETKNRIKEIQQKKPAPKIEKVFEFSRNFLIFLQEPEFEGEEVVFVKNSNNSKQNNNKKSGKKGKR